MITPRTLGWMMAALVPLAALVITAVLVDAFGTQAHAQKADVIIVLGARVLQGGEASDVLKVRVEHAVELYRRGLAPALLFSGGVGDFPPSEASVAQALAVAAGVPLGACLLEEHSHSTAENARMSAQVLQARGLTRAIVVTDPYHALRAHQYFNRERIETYSSPALLAPRHLSAAQRIRWTLREAVALLSHPWLWFA